LKKPASFSPEIHDAGFMSSGKSGEPGRSSASANLLAGPVAPANPV